MEKRLIEEMLDDLGGGNDSFSGLNEADKQAMAVLLYLYNEQIEAVAGEWPSIFAWLEECGFDTYVDVPAILFRLRELNILNPTNKFRKKKDSDSDILWILFVQVLEGVLECEFKDGEYFFKITEEGQKKVEAMIKDSSNDT